MEKKTCEKICKCINYLKEYGYEVYKREDSNIGKWVAFRQEGMPMVLHGKIIDKYNTCYVIKCKNGQKGFAGLEDIIGLYDSKAECYSVKN